MKLTGSTNKASLNNRSISDEISKTKTSSTSAQLKQAPAKAVNQLKEESRINVTQLVGGPEEEEPLQMKQAFQLQSADEEDALQMKTVQLAGVPEEEEPLQMKKPFQMQAANEEEEPLQMKAIQLIGGPEEEEPLQMKKPFQMQDSGKEMPLQMETAQLESVDETEEIQLKPAQLKENKTGLPDNLKSGIENLSGIDVSDVKVHYNSSQPAQLNALAYAQGTDIHVAPGQEQHLPHEAWHVVQQKQDRVHPTIQMKAGVAVNDDAGLEHEADVMGAKALQMISDREIGTSVNAPKGATTIQRKLPISKTDYYNGNKESIDKNNNDGERTPVSKETFTNLDYLISYIKPYLLIRKDLILSYKGEDDWNRIWKDLAPFENYWSWSRDNDQCEVFSVLSKSQKVKDIIAFADDLEDMHTAPAIAGGYRADAGLKSSMPALQKTLTDIGITEGEVVKTGSHRVEGLDVPVISNGTFLSSAAIPASLKRLVQDIHLHWKAGGILDTRDSRQKAEKAKTPDQAAALRTWHMNEHASLPAVGDAELDHPLHEHYKTNSQPGNVHDGDEPVGYAEYTGIDSDQNKIVLNYTTGDIFVTAVHYKYWYDETGKAPEVTSGSLETAKAQKPASAAPKDIRSPWVKIEM